MARKWKDGDSARTMTNKYNEVVTDVLSLREKTSSLDSTLETEIKSINEAIDSKLEKTTALKELGLDKVNNTSDIDKPVSIPQSVAIELATVDKLTSEPITTELVEDYSIGFLAEIKVDNTKLCIVVR